MTVVEWLTDGFLVNIVLIVQFHTQCRLLRTNASRLAIGQFLAMGLLLSPLSNGLFGAGPFAVSPMTSSLLSAGATPTRATATTKAMATGAMAGGTVPPHGVALIDIILAMRFIIGIAVCYIAIPYTCYKRDIPPRIRWIATLGSCMGFLGIDAIGRALVRVPEGLPALGLSPTPARHFRDTSWADATCTGAACTGTPRNNNMPWANAAWADAPTSGAAVRAMAFDVVIPRITQIALAMLFDMLMLRFMQWLTSESRFQGSSRLFLAFSTLQCVLMTAAITTLTLTASPTPMVLVTFMALTAISFIVDVAMGESIYADYRAEVERQNARILSEQLDAALSRYDTLSQRLERAAKQRHDWRNHIGTIAALAERGDIDASRALVASIRAEYADGDTGRDTDGDIAHMGAAWTNDGTRPYGGTYATQIGEATATDRTTARGKAAEAGRETSGGAA